MLRGRDDVSGDELRSWVRDQVTRYGSVQHRYQGFAETLHAILARAASELAPLAIVQTRAKSIPSFAGKILRKRGESPDPVNQFTDLCGGRVIARTRSEVDALARYIEDHFEIDWENSVDTSERLRPAEFGYRSVHYIVSCRRDVDYGVTVPHDHFGLEAEVQLRTLTEHAYSDFVHDLTYKGSFPLPLPWLRQLAGAAATLEEVDGVFARIEQGLREYATSFGAYLDPDQMREEMARLDIVREHDPENPALASRMAQLAITLGEWQPAIDILAPFVADEVESTPQPVLRNLGVALCRRHRDRPTGDEYRRGQRYLELAAAPEHGDVEAMCSHGATWSGLDDARARDVYRSAFELDPADPTALGSYLELELPRDPALLASIRPLLRRGIARARAHVEVGINLPGAHFDHGLFRLMLDEPYESLDAYARAIRTSSAAFGIEAALGSLGRLAEVLGHLPGFEWARRLLSLGLACRFPSADAAALVEATATPDTAPLRAPVVIVAGGTDPRVEDDMQGYAGLLERGFSRYRGTVVSGGTSQGISGVVAQLGTSAGDRLRTVGYLPELVPADASPDARYDELRQTSGHGFSPLEPLQSWADVVASGHAPGSVRVVGVNGGRIAGTEYRMALALGATVGLVADSGREAGRLFADDDWASADNLVRLPADAETIAAFVGPGPRSLPDEIRATVALGVHDAYRQARTAERAAADPALSPWDLLEPDLRESNRRQADHIADKLARIGCAVVAADAPGEPAQLTADEIEDLAEMEHGRWVAERLLAGWTWGEERDLANRTSPYLVSWADLPDEIREYDRETVRNIPALLGTVGLSIRRQPSATSGRG